MDGENVAKVTLGDGRLIRVVLCICNRPSLMIFTWKKNSERVTVPSHFLKFADQEVVDVVFALEAKKC